MATLPKSCEEIKGEVFCIKLQDWLPGASYLVPVTVRVASPHYQDANKISQLQSGHV